MTNNNKNRDLTVILGAAFLMATSAIGPGFLTQTAKFTEDLGSDFAFVILVSVIMSYIAQINVWRIIAASRMKGQDIANAVLPGLGYVVAFMVALGGLAFNIGNVGGAGLGFNVLFGLDNRIGAAISAVIAIGIFSSKEAGDIMDKLTQVLGGLMIILIAIVVVYTKPPVGEALKRTVMPTQMPIVAIVTLVGGTVGGYITFSGGHRLLDAGVTGVEKLPEVQRSARTGMGVALIVRVLFFLAVLGVVSKGLSLDPENPAADAFLIGAGNLGYKFFGVVLWAASISSVIGAAYTSVSFLTSMSEKIRDNPNKVIMIFIAVSTIIMIFAGSPAKLLVLAGSLNGLILPLTLGAILLASRKKEVVGDYEHPTHLIVLGAIVVVIMLVLGVKSLSGLKALF